MRDTPLTGSSTSQSLRGRGWRHPEHPAYLRLPEQAHGAGRFKEAIADQSLQVANISESMPCLGCATSTISPIASIPLGVDACSNAWTHVCAMMNSANSSNSHFSLDALYDYSKGNFTVTGPTATASIFSTYPAPYMSLPGSFFTEVSGDCWDVLGKAGGDSVSARDSVQTQSQPLLQGVQPSEQVPDR